jgi:DNA polymerase-3 subunit epsilon
MIQIKKPIAFIDVEATGLNLIQDRLVEISVLKVGVDNSQTQKTWRVNPERTIPEKIAKLINITDEEVQQLSTFKQVAKDVAKFLEGCDFGGFNLNQLDLPMLMEEFIKADVPFDMSNRKIIDVQKIFFMMEPRNLSAAYKFYCEKDLQGQHTAEADAMATYEVFLAQLEKYKDESRLPKDIDKLSKIANHNNPNVLDLVGRIVMNDNNEEIFNFGKYKGQKVADVLSKDRGYYNWMMNGEFTQYTKKKLTEIKLKYRV